MFGEHFADGILIQQRGKSELLIKHEAVQCIPKRHRALPMAIRYTAHRKTFLGLISRILPRKALKK
jgi:hypothetical protein